MSSQVLDADRSRVADAIELARSLLEVADHLIGPGGGLGRADQQVSADDESLRIDFGDGLFGGSELLSFGAVAEGLTVFVMEQPGSGEQAVGADQGEGDSQFGRDGGPLAGGLVVVFELRDGDGIPGGFIVGAGKNDLFGLVYAEQFADCVGVEDGRVAIEVFDGDRLVQ